MDYPRGPESDNGRVAGNEASSPKGGQKTRDSNDVVESQIESCLVPADKHLSEARSRALNNSASKLLAHGKKFCADGKGSGSIQVHYSAKYHDLTGVHELRAHSHPDNILAKRENLSKKRQGWSAPVTCGRVEATFPADQKCDNRAKNRGWDSS
jgi:hypothetical protein